MAETLIELREYQPELLAANDLSASDGEALWRRFGTQVTVDFPSPQTGGLWRLTSEGWVGLLPLTKDLRLLLLPRIPLKNLFAMWEYAYRLRQFRLPEGLVSSGSVDGFYSQLAGVLAKRVMLRLRKGIYKTYRPEKDELTCVRGSLDLRHRLRSPWRPSLVCEFEEHTEDIVENKIIAWTLFSVARSGLCQRETLRWVQAAYRGMAGAVSLEAFGPEACINRLYHRLNEDYEPLHALCRFFLAHSGPHYAAGDSKTIPFLFEMPRLYEMFVAEWLRAHQGERFRFHPHYHVTPDSQCGMTFDIDLVLRDIQGNPLCVLDTKYKVGKPATEDVFQVIAYALSMGCEQAFLVYPMKLSDAFEMQVGPIRVSAVGFDISDDLDTAGEEFLQQILSKVQN